MVMTNKWVVAAVVTVVVVGAVIVTNTTHHGSGRHHRAPGMRKNVRSLTKHLDRVSEYIIANARIYPIDTPTNQGFQQAMAVQNGIVLELSNNLQELVERYRFPVHDMGGNTIIPGLIDAHVHMQNEGLTLVRAQLMYSTSVAEVISRINDYVIEFNIQPGDWILGRGWDNTRFPGQAWPTKQDLDVFFPNNPIYLTRVDGHAAWANSPAMDLADIPDTGDVPGGQILRDENNDPIGIFIDNAMYLITEILPVPSKEEKIEGLELAIEKCHSYGITNIHDASRPPQEDIELFVELADEGRLNLRSYLMLDAMSPKIQELYCGSDPLPQLIDHKERLTIRSVKIGLDGALGSRGAAMIEPYDDEPDNSGLLRHTPEAFESSVNLWAECGFQVNTHAIGDLANKLSLDVYEDLFERNATYQDLRMRIEHAQIMRLEDIPRFAELQVLPSVQPTHCTSDMRYAIDRIGPERAKGAYIWKTFFDQGLMVPMGSDFPVEEVDPFLGLYSAVSRQDLEGMPPGGFYPEERVSIYDAIRGFTIMAAYGAFEEDLYGSLEPGKRADFAVLDRDILAEADNDFRMLLSVEVVATFLDGQCVYNSEGGEQIGLCAKK